VKKSDMDLTIDQLHEVFHVLAADKVPTTKLEKRLDELAHKWDEVKKVQPQVKSDVEPVQVRLAVLEEAGQPV
jgi:dynein heavy chain